MRSCIIPYKLQGNLGYYVPRIDIFLDSAMHIFIRSVQIFVRAVLFCLEYMSVEWVSL
jgi:hypothetical protein